MANLDAVSGKVVTITGAARGIGYATAKALKDAGAEVVIGDIDETAVKEAGARLGVRATVVDVTDRASYEAFYAFAEAEAGPIDVAVNNAGIMPVGHLLEQTDETIRRCVDINLHGVVCGTRLALTRMIGRGSGHVINIASLSGLVPVPGQAVYNATKFGVVGFTEATRLEFAGKGIEVSAVLPTFTNTELIAGTRSPKGQQNAEPEDIAAAVLGLIRKPRPQAIVPSSLGAQLRVQQFLPRRVREALARRLGIYDVFLDVDTEARKAYDQRING